MSRFNLFSDVVRNDLDLPGAYYGQLWGKKAINRKPPIDEYLKEVFVGF